VVPVHEAVNRQRFANPGQPVLLTPIHASRIAGISRTARPPRRPVADLLIDTQQVERLRQASRIGLDLKWTLAADFRPYCERSV
jgi:hypothetical protein